MSAPLETNRIPWGWLTTFLLLASAIGMMGAYFALTAATEACASLEEQRRWIMLSVGGLIIAAGAIIVFLWRLQRAAFYREKYRAEHALQTSEQRYRTLFETAPLIIYTLDATGHLTALNPAFERVTGWKCADWLGRSFTEIIPPEDLPTMTQVFQRALRGELPNYAERRILSASGAILTLEILGLQQVVAGQVVGVAGFARAVTERKRAEVALRESEEKYRNLVERANDGIVIIQDGQVRYANARVLELWGGTAEQVLGTPFTDYIAPAFLAVVVERYHRRIAGEPVAPMFEAVLRRKDGTPVYAELNAGLVTFDGKPADLVIIRDLTERKRAEEKLRESEELYRDLVEHSHAFICSHDLQGRFLSANQWALQLMGYETFPAAPVNLRDILAPEVRGEVDEYLARIQRDGAAQGLMLVQTRTGEKRIWEYHNTLRIEGVVEPIVRGIAHDITEQKQLERALRESEERWRAYIEQANDLIFALDASGRVTLANRALCSTLGYAAEELVGTSPLEFIAPEVRDPAMSALKRVFGGEEVERFEAEAIARDQRRIVLEIRGRTFRKDGKIVGTLHIARDVTERKRAEEELRQLKEFNERIVQNMAEGITVENAAGYFTFVNPAAARLLGYAPDELIGAPWTVVVPPDQQAIVQAADERRTQGQVDRYEAQLVCKDGTRRFVLVAGTPRFESGKFAGSLAVFTDITERKRAEEALQEANARFVALVEGMPDVVYLKDAHGCNLYVNKAYEDFAGTSRPNIVGKSDDEIMPPELATQCRQSDVQVLQQGGTLRSEECHTDRAGNLIWYETIKCPILDTTGNVSGLVGVSRDITERKRAEAVLQEYSERLGQMVEARTRELRDAQEQLIRQERLTVLGQIAGGIGHELRSPLGAIKNAVYLLNLSLPAPDPEAQEILQILKCQVEASDRVIASLLDFARAQPPYRRETDLRETIDAALGRITVPENITVSRRFDDTFPALSVDPDQLEIAFSNLIRNAVQAMPGGGRLTIDARSFGKEISISFSDTGVGIAPDVLDKLFQPMFSTKAHGIGLGLALCKLLVEGHGGRIEVTSQVGKGTTFVVYLPLPHEVRDE